jgi:Iap family predicted aminopeptidase
MRRRVAALAVAAAALAGCGAEDPDGRSERRAGAQPGQAQPPPAPAAPVDAAGVREHLAAFQRIADQSGGNRAAGTPGDRRTAEYLAGQLRATGWRVRLQTVRFPFFEQLARPRVGALRRGEATVLRYSGSARLSGRARPLDTPGCDARELGRLRGTDVAILPRGTCTFRVKALAAQRAGAGALVIVDRDAGRPFRGTLGQPGVRIPVVSVGRDAGARLARSDGPVAFDVRTTSEQRRTRNVLAETPSTTARTRRVAMAGAHLDSVEEGPGINDNASGMAALLELAERLRDRAGLRIGFWAAEELGLYGSRAYVRSLGAAERRRLSAYLNLDMLGSPNPAALVYDTDDEVEELLRDARPGDEGETDIGGASDHAPFDRAGIAVGGYFTGAQERAGNGRAADPCYHRRCDTIGNVDEDALVAMTRAAQRALPQLRLR